MAKFNVGDKVIGNKKASCKYRTTVTGWIGIVTKIEYGLIYVKSCNGKDPALYHVHPSYFDLYEPAKENIEVVCKGRTVTATYKKGSIIILSAKAKCHPEDKFDFLTGAKIATERLMKKIEENKQPTELYYGDTCYGTIGEATPYHDCSGKPLFVGDIVKIWAFDERGRLFNHGRNFVVFNENPFIMGIRYNCKENGIIKSDAGFKWFVEKITDHREVKRYTKHGSIEAR